MNKNYRLRTQVGVDKEIQVQIDQDWESIEVLSLKLLQSDIYDRMCSDYGVVAGRVVANGGYGVPNAKVSIFVPLSATDALDPIISTLYPYVQIGDVNEEGYRYNLLPYEPSHGGHTPTGTFPTVNDVLTNQTVLQIYEKYYKYTVKTNSSGDYMIFGAPLGNQTVVMDLDLSDMGPFSLGPQDLINMGRATADQIKGTRFAASTNLDELPQIVTLSENIEVSPFWGNEELCQVKIERVDFDLRKSGIEITPTAIFMGSILSNDDDSPQKISCRPSLSMGELCSLTTGPGQIIAIRQTPILDEYNRPFLEQYKLTNDGNVIDENGTWMTEVPMNLDNIITNEFGEQIISSDPRIGIPSSAKYRFKIKWNQSNELTGEVRRGYFLVPNLREHGWGNSKIDPLIDEPTSSINHISAKASYYFGLDWTGYTTASTVTIDQRIEDAINCVDTFYKMEYNKVYTVAQHIDQFSRGTLRNRFIGIKAITDRDCESENNKFPITDGVMNTDVVYLLITFLLSILFFPLLTLIFVTHILSLIFPIVKYLVAIVFGYIFGFLGAICQVINFLGGNLTCPKASTAFNSIAKIKNPFVTVPLPMLDYPECNSCSCKAEPLGEGEFGDAAQEIFEENTNSCTANFFSFQNYTIGSTRVPGPGGVISAEDNQKAMAGIGSPNTTERIVRLRTPIYTNGQFGLLSAQVGTVSNPVLPIWERANLFNLKSKYFDTDSGIRTAGTNRVKVIFEPNQNSGNTNNYHYDSVIIYLVNNDCINEFKKGQLLTFTAPIKSGDFNPTAVQSGTTTLGVTGTQQSTTVMTVNWADETNPLSGKQTTYTVSADTKETKYKFPSDLEYFQVITAMTVADITAITNPSTATTIGNNFVQRVLLNPTENAYRDYYQGFSGLGVVIMVRGVDPHSGRKKVRYNISRLLGWTTYLPQYDIDGDYYFNIPIQTGTTAVEHDLITQSSGSTLLNQKLFYPSYEFIPGSGFSSYTTSAHTYYSSLDCSSVSRYFIDPLNGPATTLLSRFVRTCTSALPFLSTTSSPSTNRLVTNNQTGAGYFSNEYIEGGSFITSEVVTTASGTWLNDYKYFAPTYTGITVTVNKTNIVMRSDRLPTGSILNTSGNNVFALQASNSMSLTLFDDQGLSQTREVFESSGTLGDNDRDDFATGETYNKVIESFSCQGMVDLSCYSGSGTKFTSKGPDDECNKNGIPRKYKKVNNGCYSFVNQPIITIPSDILQLSEWVNRYRFMMALCRGVVGHSFVNSWINGTLYAFPFALQTVYDRNNKPKSEYCKETLYLDNDTYNFYYRSSPFNDNTNAFIGKEAQGYNFNDLHIQTPVTLLDMGPKYFWSREVSFSSNYYGYIMDQIPVTSYQDVGDLGTLLAVSRLTNSNFLSYMVGNFSDAIVRRLFNRPNNRVDGDFAQALQINSQYGVFGFTNENYQETTSISTSPIFVGSDNSLLSQSLIGVFFSADTQLRDYISPRRIIRNQTNSTLIFADELPENSQRVPLYQWNIENNSNYIFGTQNNHWETKEFWQTEKYQNLKRELKGSPGSVGSNFYIGDSIIPYFRPGYIFSATKTSTPNSFDYAPIKGANHSNKTIVSAPWYFYFGLKKGKTAMDKFYSTYIDRI